MIIDTLALEGLWEKRSPFLPYPEEARRMAGQAVSSRDGWSTCKDSHSFPGWRGGERSHQMSLALDELEKFR